MNQETRPENEAIQSLFRPEAMSGNSQNSLGAIRLAQPTSSWLVTTIAVAIAVALISYVALGSFTRKTRVTGITVASAGDISIKAPITGVMTQSYIAEGDHVKEGQALFSLSSKNQSEHGEIAALVSNQLSARQQSLDQEERLRIGQTEEKRQILNLKQKSTQDEIFQVEQEIILAQQRYAYAEEDVKKFETLQNSGFVSTTQLQDKQKNLIDVGKSLSVLRREKLHLVSNRYALQSEFIALSKNLAVERIQLGRERSAIQQDLAENSSRKGRLILAPKDGFVTALANQVGHSISADQHLATLTPGKSDSDKLVVPVEVHLFATSKDSGFVEKGQSIRVRYHAYPYQKFGLFRGKVTSISTSPFAPHELPLSVASTILGKGANGFNTTEALYRIRVELADQKIESHGKQIHIRPGMTLEADVLQENKRIWEWILEPLIAVARR